MKALLVYFSGTGNTAFAARQIEQELKKHKIETEMHRVEEKAGIYPDTIDYLILGCPKYYEYPSLDFIHWIKECIPVSKRIIPTMVFVTQVGPLATDWRGIKKALLKRGYRLIVAKSFPIANNMMIFSFFPPTDEKKVRANIDKMRTELSILIDDLVNGRDHIETIGKVMGALEKLAAIVFTKLFAAFFVKYSASQGCTGCSLCAKRCPKGNIKMKEGKPVFGNKCMFCMRCINKCPVNAILYNKKQCQQLKLPK